MSQPSYPLFIGSYAQADEAGIHLYLFNEETGECTPLDSVEGIPNPSYLTLSPSGKLLYAVAENGESSAVATLSFDNALKKLTLLNTVAIHQADPCHISLSPKAYFAATANYSGGSISLCPLAADGQLLPPTQTILFEGKGMDKARQATPHLHNILFSPDGRYLFAADLGTDKIHRLRVIDRSQEEANKENPLLVEEQITSFPLTPGSGPRHLCLHPTGKYLYLINELSGMVTAFTYNDGELKQLQYIAADSLNAQGSADIHISPDGRHLYASNRLKGDGMAIFRIDQTTGVLTHIGYQATGRHPRNFAFSRNGKFMLVACRDENAVEMYAVDTQTGLLTDTGKRIEISKPVCVKIWN